MEERSIPLGSCTFVGTNRPKGETRLDPVEQTNMTSLMKLLNHRSFVSILKKFPKVAQCGCPSEAKC